ncbi:unnamed protein product [Rhizoctonia solani]|uniref:Uncharacterized protein n=1 Tax=Rhizoctonia solani TaxID=456999 RepID=A0A8H3E1Q5_9AGAM|nr:unnamed protein product [Rhizoctonia solani]
MTPRLNIIEPWAHWRARTSIELFHFGFKGPQDPLTSQSTQKKVRRGDHAAKELQELEAVDTAKHEKKRKRPADKTLSPSEPIPSPRSTRNRPKMRPVPLLEVPVLVAEVPSNTPPVSPHHDTCGQGRNARSSQSRGTRWRGVSEHPAVGKCNCGKALKRLRFPLARSSFEGSRFALLIFDVPNRRREPRWDTIIFI